MVKLAGKIYMGLSINIMDGHRRHSDNVFNHSFCIKTNTVTVIKVSGHMHSNICYIGSSFAIRI